MTNSKEAAVCGMPHIAYIIGGVIALPQWISYLLN